MTQTARAPARSRSLIRAALIIILIVLIAAFGLANTQTVRIHFFMLAVNASLIWALVLSAAVGLVVGLIAPYGARRIRRR